MQRCLALTVVFLLAAIASAQEDQAESSTALRVKTFFQEPFFYLDENGDYAGLEYDVLRSFAESEGRDLEVLQLDASAKLLEELDAGLYDLGSGTLTITPERLEILDFSRSYFPLVVVLVERRGEESKSLEDLKGKTIATGESTSYIAILQEVEGVEFVFPDYPRDGISFTEGLFKTVSEGGADALAVDSALYLWLADDYPDLTLTLGLSETKYYAFVFRKGNPLKDRLDAHIDHLKETGELRDFLLRAFGKWGTSVILEMTEGLDF